MQSARIEGRKSPTPSRRLGGSHPAPLAEPGAAQRFGNREPPTAAYGGESPVLYHDEDEDVWFGGMFWDGRATGWALGDPLTEQAPGPFRNPVEQNNPNARLVCAKVAQSDYADLYEEVWGEPPGFKSSEDVETTHARIGISISAYEQSAEVNPFTSKYDIPGSSRRAGTMASSSRWRRSSTSTTPATSSSGLRPRWT